MQTWRLCAIDGLSASGKSCLATALAKEAPGAIVVSLDDFFLAGPKRRFSPFGRNYDLLRLQMQVIEPVIRGSDATYQPFDWSTGQPSKDDVHIPAGTPVILDGTYTLDLELRHGYDFSIWVETPGITRRSRKMKRGLSYEEALNDQVDEEKTYLESVDPKSHATLTVLGGEPFPPTAEIWSHLFARAETDWTPPNREVS